MSLALKSLNIMFSRRNKQDWNQRGGSLRQVSYRGGVSGKQTRSGVPGENSSTHGNTTSSFSAGTNRRGSRGGTEARRSEELEKRHNMRPDHQIRKFLSLKYCLSHYLSPLPRLQLTCSVSFKLPVFLHNPTPWTCMCLMNPTTAGNLWTQREKIF